MPPSEMKICGDRNQRQYFRTLGQLEKISHASPNHQDGGNSRAIAPLRSLEGLGAHPQSEQPTRRTTINQRESAVAAFIR